MKNILQIIADAGIELTDEQKTSVEAGVKENYKTVSDYDKQTKKVTDLTAERDQYKSQYDTAAETLRGFDGKDFDAITRERDDWKTRAEQADADFQRKLKDAQDEYARQIEERDFSDTLSKALASEKFTSEFAKNGIIGMIKEKGLKREGEKILGLDDYLKELRESQKDAFAPTEDAPKAPTYTKPTGNAGGQEERKTFTAPKVW